MVTCSNILVAMVLILVCNCNTVICQVNGCSGRDFRCGPHGPPIRFPFRLKDKEEKYGCSYPGFELTCSDTRKTLIELPTHSGPIQLEVIQIIYEIQRLFISDPENCLPKQFLKLLHSQISPFQLFERSDNNYSYTFMDCSSLTCPVYVAYSDENFLDSGLDPILCTKTLDVISSPVPPIETHKSSGSFFALTWSKPNCSKCEVEDKMCKLKNNGTEDEIECFDRHHKPTKKIILYATG